jgi:hypothetical protein
MLRIGLWVTGFIASVVMIGVATLTRSVTCVDSPDLAPSSCTENGSGCLSLLGLATLALSTWMLWRIQRSRRHDVRTPWLRINRSVRTAKDEDSNHGRRRSPRLVVGEYPAPRRLAQTPHFTHICPHPT